jgi:hypothetical protein
MADSMYMIVQFILPSHEVKGYELNCPQIAERRGALKGVDGIRSGIGEVELEARFAEERGKRSDIFFGSQVYPTPQTAFYVRLPPVFARRGVM